MEDQTTEIPQSTGLVETSHPKAWHVVGAAVQGVSHVRTGLPCQDAQASQVLPGGVVLAVVADGAGTARLSDQGAQLAVQETLFALEAALGEALPQDVETWQNLMRSAFLAARQAVLGLAERAAESSREYACTLVAAVATASWLAVGMIGDGAVVARDQNGDLFAATHLQRGEYANETHFLVEDDGLEQAVVDVFERPVSGLAVMSDGLIRLALKLPSQDPHRPFFEPLFRFAGTMINDVEAVEQLSSFLDSDRVNARTDDDKALVLAVRRNEGRGQE